MKNKHIGYWNDNKNSFLNLPMPIENSANNDQIVKMLDNLNKLKNKSTTLYYKGSSICRICNCVNGSGEFHYINKGVKYIVPEGIIHYISDHKVLIQDLIDININ